MATTSHINGSLVNIYINGTPIARSTNCTLKISQNIIDATVKEDGGWFAGLPGLRNASLSVEGAVYYPGTYGYNHSGLASLIVNRAGVTWVMRTSVSGDTYFTGAAYVASVDTSNPVEDQATFSAELTVSGAITIGTV